jgi:hypothetical protein
MTATLDDVTKKKAKASRALRSRLPRSWCGG